LTVEVEAGFESFDFLSELIDLCLLGNDDFHQFFFGQLWKNGESLRAIKT
jgi:hypothetical protein